MIWVGTCGLRRRRADAFRELHVVEVQQSFYRPVPAERARKWRSAAPRDFGFSVKASQFITHESTSPTYRRAGRPIPDEARARYGGFQDTPEVRAGWEATRAVSEILEARVVVFQSPASFRPTEKNLAALYRFFESIETPAVKAWEPRGPWPTHIVEKVCADLGLVHAVDPFAAEPVTLGLAYFRLHGSPPGKTLYRYTYTDADLARLRGFSEEYDDAYVLFNNQTMHEDALRFRRLVEATATDSRAWHSGMRKGEETFL